MLIGKHHQLWRGLRLTYSITVTEADENFLNGNSGLGALITRHQFGFRPRSFRWGSSVRMRPSLRARLL